MIKISSPLVLFSFFFLYIDKLFLGLIFNVQLLDYNF